MDRAHERVVEAQFGPRAKAYVESAVHAQGADLDALEAIVRELQSPRALDLGTGGGPVSSLVGRPARTGPATEWARGTPAAAAAPARALGLANNEAGALPG